MSVNRVFLSHSSVNKDFVRLVKAEFGDTAIIDEVDFAAGARTMDEIVEKINDSKIFVAFLSQEALESDWVQKELAMAVELVESRDLDMLVFSFDNDVTYTNKLIPEKLRKHYNIRYVNSVEIAVSRIKERLLLMAIKDSPALRESENLFIGRADIVGQFESDFTTIDGSLPTFIVASNYYKGMGRRRFCRHALDKIGILKSTQVPIEITLTKGESIENYILKLNSYLYADEESRLDLHSLDLDTKIEVAIRLTRQYKRNSRLIFIQDRGAIVLPNHQIVDWFYRLTQAPELKNNVTFCLISSWEPNYRYLDGDNRGVAYHVSELNKIDTQNLFLMLLNIFGKANIPSEEKNEFINRLTGIPSQIKFAVQQIKAIGSRKTLQNIDSISGYSDSYSASLLDAIRGNEIALQIVLLLSDGPLSLNVLADVFPNADELKVALSFIEENSAIDFIEEGATVVVLNSTFADFIKRRRLRPSAAVESSFQKAISRYAKLGLDKLINDDFTKFMLTLNKCLKEDKEIPQKYFLAPLLINNIIKDYYAGKYTRVERMCLKLLNQHNVDAQVTWELQYHLVRVYARTGDKKFWKALKNSDLSGKDKLFLQGFYYRNLDAVEDIKKALPYFKEVLEIDPSHSRALREIVNTYILLDDYPNALRYAKDNYLNNPKDILHLQSYFVSLIRNGETDNLEDLMEAAAKNADPRAGDVLRCMKGEYAFWVEKDLAKAERLLEEAANMNENKRFPLKALIPMYKKRGYQDRIIEIKKRLSKL